MSSNAQKLSDFHLSQLLGGITGNKKFKNVSTGGDAILETLFTDCENFRAPFYISDTFVCRERYPIYSELLTPHKSSLIDLLKENYNESCLISDSVFRGKAGLFFVTLTNDRLRITEWISFLKKLNIHSVQLNMDYFLMSSVSSFVDN